MQANNARRAKRRRHGHPIYTRSTRMGLLLDMASKRAISLHAATFDGSHASTGTILGESIMRNRYCNSLRALQSHLSGNERFGSRPDNRRSESGQYCAFMQGMRILRKTDNMTLSVRNGVGTSYSSETEAVWHLLAYKKQAARVHRTKG
ncbi:hypothetical protein MPSEU_000059300 [Mayamaea pseudoterrestris]|nr:hypothetical protein MPSEU_000059300 [Mayamaea pseudoterrestris]